MLFAFCFQFSKRFSFESRSVKLLFKVSLAVSYFLPDLSLTVSYILVSYKIRVQALIM